MATRQELFIIFAYSLHMLVLTLHLLAYICTAVKANTQKEGLKSSPVHW